MFAIFSLTSCPILKKTASLKPVYVVYLCVKGFILVAIIRSLDLAQTRLSCRAVMIPTTKYDESLLKVVFNKKKKITIQNY